VVVVVSGTVVLDSGGMLLLGRLTSGWVVVVVLVVVEVDDPDVAVVGDGWVGEAGGAAGSPVWAENADEGCRLGGRVAGMEGVAAWDVVEDRCHARSLGSGGVRGTVLVA
jgi:hypothetical protein